ncbi:MAG: hypothetical protein RL071_2417 [Pseudomonadota bacterium]|jgi:hypothetical protein
MASQDPRTFTDPLSKHPGLFAWIFGFAVGFGFLGLLYASAGSH